MADPGRVPMKGKPDFTNFSDESLETGMETVQSLIHAYGAFSEEREILFRIWKAILDHQIDRDAFGCKTTKKIADSKPYRLSPAGRKTKLFIG